MNLGRLSALAAGLPVTVAGQTIYRQCASGLLAISIAAHQTVQEGMDVVIAAGQENFSALQGRYGFCQDGRRGDDPCRSRLYADA